MESYPLLLVLKGRTRSVLYLYQATLRLVVELALRTVAQLVLRESRTDMIHNMLWT